ncbi:MAG: fumarylacetoacetate hydrolase family protein [Dehalococcoidia bacterium]|nr:fumarylacetoacetate hydrolase family protein [Dehalococcoidia bacterium]
MKVVRFSAGSYVGCGILQGECVRTARRGRRCEADPHAPAYDLSDVKLLAPCRPSKVIALGINYKDHAKEFEHELPKVPLMFLKPATAVIGPGEAIVYPPTAQQVDFEGELGVVIRRLARKISVREARDYILGYTCINDVTARDLQRKDGQWTRAKGFDTFAPLGPWIETELDPASLLIETYLNGVRRQKASTAELIFPVSEIVSFVSSVMTLLPGDVIATGTPSGVGPMQPGDIVEVRIQGIGSLKNCVVQA